MKVRINEEIGTSISESIKSLMFIDIGSYLTNKAGSLVVMIPDVGAQKILKWVKFVATNPIYAQNKDTFEALSARFSGNTILNSIYSKINKIKSRSVSSSDENVKREQEISRELGRAGRYIQSKLTDVEKQLFAKVSADLRNPSILLVKSLNDKLSSTVATPEPSEPEEPAQPAPTEKEPTKDASPAKKEEPSADAPTGAAPVTQPKTKTPPAPAANEKPTKQEPVSKDKPVAPATTAKPKQTTPPEKTADVPAEKPAKPVQKQQPPVQKEPAQKQQPATPKQKPEEKPKDTSTDTDDDTKEESYKSAKARLKEAIRSYVIREIANVVNEAEMNGEMNWKSLCSPLLVGGREVGYVLPNGVKLNTSTNQITVESPDLIRKVVELISKRVIIPVKYQKGHNALMFTYNEIDEDSLGQVLSGIK